MTHSRKRGRKAKRGRKRTLPKGMAYRDYYGTISINRNNKERLKLIMTRQDKKYDDVITALLDLNDVLHEQFFKSTRVGNPHEHIIELNKLLREIDKDRGEMQ